jgi:hypothetical protein
VRGSARLFRYDLELNCVPPRPACVAMPARRRMAASPTHFWRPTATIHNELKSADSIRP